MSRIRESVLLVCLLVPAAAHAQSRPTNSMHTRSAEVYLGRAAATSRAEEKREMFAKALEVLAPGMSSDANNPKVWFFAGQAYAGLGDVAGADSAFDRAETMYPDYVKEATPHRQNLWIARYNAGVMAIQAGNEAEAIRSFEEADRVFRGRPDALVSLGSLYVRTREMAKAEKAYRDALELMRGEAAKGLSAEAAAEWKEQEEVASTQLADLLAAAGKPDEAAGIYRALLERQPDNAQVMNNLAVTLSRAGKAEEAAKVYAQLIDRKDLNDVALFNIGVGLYGAEQFERSAEAFRRAIALNPNARDVLYNLGQALFASAGKLEATRTGASAEARAKASSLHEELLATSTKLIAIDPYNRNALMMAGEAQRSLGELSTDPAKAEEWKKQVLATLEMAEALDFEVTQLTVDPVEHGSTIRGSLKNLKLAAGTPVTLKFTLLDASGAAITSGEISMTAGEPESAVSFSGDVRSDKAAAAWKYERVR